MAPSPGSFPSHPTAFPGPYQYTGDLPLGSWRMLANGRVYELEISGVQGGRVDATLSTGTVKEARWTGVANALTLAELSFKRVLPARGLTQQFTGYLLHYDETDPLWRLVGTFGDVDVGTQAGWYATLPKKK